MDERQRWLALLEADEKAVRWDLPDLCRFMMATGVRIGEALALYWEDVDFKRATVDIRYTVQRIKGRGLVRGPTKTAAGERLLPLPKWALDMIMQRYADIGCDVQPVFPADHDGLRDPSNTNRVFRQARGTDEFAWVTSHVFRKTAATVLDDAGFSARMIADQLGHAQPSMTQDVYLGRKLVNPEIAVALEDVLSKKSG
ncbi:site-specific integrase [Tamaricihabitans halophyticus]|uniref:site-specific integrase n=1 Tax=Tamaricihabitans halophyticus TaxID=1262583 RepID=UPI001FB2CC77|nr:site-specific integrase [Tamaricihabitans halophyticus]